MLGTPNNLRSIVAVAAAIAAGVVPLAIVWPRNARKGNG
jgi:hypothetical protein